MPTNRANIRTIFIGDIHGCARELEDLLQSVNANKDDRIICVGDLICKGPDSLGVMEWALNSSNVECVLGNHEARFLDCWRTREIPGRKSYDLETFRQLGNLYNDCMLAIDNWPLFINESDFLVVHAGIDPEIRDLHQQKPDELTNLRNLAASGSPWYESYQDKKPIIFGHWARPDPVIRSNAIGLDTGCVYGGHLTAYLWPERKIVQVAARREYRKKESRFR